MVVFRPIRFLLFTHTLHLVSSCLLFEMLGETQVYLHTAPLSLKLTTPGAFVAENLTQKTSQTFPPLRVSAGRWRYDCNNFWLLDSVQAWCRRAWLNERNYAAVGNLSSLPQASLTWPWLHNYYVYLILTLRAPPECPSTPPRLWDMKLRAADFFLAEEATIEVICAAKAWEFFWSSLRCLKKKNQWYMSHFAHHTSDVLIWRRLNRKGRCEHGNLSCAQDVNKWGHDVTRTHIKVASKWLWSFM